MKVSMKMISKLKPCDRFNKILSQLNKKADDEEMLEVSSLVELAGVADTLWFMGEMEMKDQLVEFANGCAERAKEYAAQCAADSAARANAHAAARDADYAAHYARADAYWAAARYAHDASGAAYWAADAAFYATHYAAELNKQIQHLKELLK